MIDSLRGFVAASPKLRARGCPALVAVLTGQFSLGQLRALTSIDAVRLREQGSRAFLIYTAAPGRTVDAIALMREDHSWKLTSLGSRRGPQIHRHAAV